MVFLNPFSRHLQRPYQISNTIVLKRGDQVQEINFAMLVRRTGCAVLLSDEPCTDRTT
jgi:hypothetical protein